MSFNAPGYVPDEEVVAERLIVKVLQERGVKDYDPQVVAMLRDMMIRDSRRLLEASAEVSKRRLHPEVGFTSETNYITSDDVTLARDGMFAPALHAHSREDYNQCELINASELPALWEGDELPYQNNSFNVLLRPNWQLTKDNLEQN